MKSPNRKPNRRRLTMLCGAGVALELGILAFGGCGDSTDNPVTPNADAGLAADTTLPTVDGSPLPGLDASGLPGDAAIADSGPIPQADASTTTCWPYDRPSIATLRASTKKVFAHYFSPYPISIDNKPAATDYYTINYLNPDGEGGKFKAQGGLLRDRPIPQTPAATGVDYEEANMEIEVRRAVAIGLDGFTFDLLSSDGTSNLGKRLTKLLAAIPKVDPGFKVQLVFDMTAGPFGGGGGTDADALQGILDTLALFGNDPSLQKLPNGNIVASAFGAEKRSAAFWINALQKAAAAGHPLAFIPMPIGSYNASNFTGVPQYGASSWGARTIPGAASLAAVPATVHGNGLIWMGPVAPQDSRPKGQDVREAGNSGSFRAEWDAAISGGADWVQLITWNDYSEDSEVAPSAKTQNAFYDLSGFYTTWLKSGAQPKIARDALYYFHRAHNMSAVPTAGNVFSNAGGTPITNEIEVVGLLTAPGTLEITIAGSTTKKDVPAGIQSFKIPLVQGTPVFRLTRAGAKIVEVTSATPINNTIAYQDPLYHAGQSLTCTP